MPRFLILVILTLGHFLALGNEPKAKNGILDLREYDLSNEKPIRLEGEWEFYWNEVHSPEYFDTTTSLAPVAKVPNSWTNITLQNGDDIPGTGFATYRLLILAAKGQKLAIKIPTTGTTCKLFIDGFLVTEVGKFGTTNETSEADYDPQVVDFINEFDTVEIIAQISNYDYVKGGMWHSFSMGKENVLRKAHERDVFLNFFILGAMFIMSLYHLGLFLQRRKDIWNLYFAIATGVAAARIMASGEYIISLFSDAPWWVIMRLELGSFYFGMTIILIYLKSLFNDEIKRIPFLIGVGISSIFGLLTMFLPTVTSSSLVTPFQLIAVLILGYCVYAVIVAVKRKREGSLLFALGFTILSIFIVNDILLNMYQIYTIPMTGIGFILFLLSQSYILSAKYTNTINANEKLTLELDAINKDLEKQVLRRTQELEDSLAQLRHQQLEIQEKNSELERANNTRTKLFGIIGHDLRGPLGSLKMGLSNAYEDLNDDDIDIEDAKNVLKILAKSATRTFDLLNNLFEWAKSQTGDLHFEPEQHLLADLVHRTISPLREQLDNKKITSFVQIDPDLRVVADKNMIETVVRNLVSNAIKFTPINGNIKVWAEPAALKDEIQIHVSDTGVGIPSDRMDELFDYDRKKSTKGTNNESGTGIGLALCKEFVERNHGRITVDSEEGKGSTFTFSLKLVDTK